ncbi:Type IV leader peptidase family protein [uncultured archaeon]|nr:Type IV leader peptidase family protein [uncultured archaeon]
MNFIFILYFFGILLACFQDIKRREVDDWLNLALFFSGTAYLFFSSSISSSSIAGYGFFVFFMALVSFSLYNGRFFAGGDAKLVFALTPFFYNFTFINSLKGFFLFFIFLVLAGAIYGLLFILYLSVRDFRKLRKDLIEDFRKNRLTKYFIVIILVFLLLGFFDLFFLIAALALLLVVFLFFLTKSLEKVSFTVEKNYFDLQEGDWLRKDIKIGNRVIRASWDGLSKEDIVLIRKYKKKVVVKEGIPYVPAFLLAFIFYFLKADFLRLLFGF